MRFVILAPELLEKTYGDTPCDFWCGMEWGGVGLGRRLRCLGKKGCLGALRKESRGWGRGRLGGIPRKEGLWGGLGEKGGLGEGEDAERKGPGQKLRAGGLGGRPGWRGWGLVWLEALGPGYRGPGLGLSGGAGQGGLEGAWGRDGARGVGRVVDGVGWDEYGGWGWHFGYLNNLHNLNPAHLNYLNSLA